MRGWKIAGLCAAALVAALAPARTDDIILVSGEVIEGRVDDPATTAANRGKSGSQLVWVYRDEDGKTRRIEKSEVRYVVRKKTSWELRAEALRWYGKQVDRVKDTYQDQNRFAGTCKRRRLNEQARVHYRRAYELRRAPLQEKGFSPKIHVSLAKWCRRAGLAKEMRGEYREAYALKRRELLAQGTKARGLLDLASWCDKVELRDEAVSCYEEILMIDPANAKARKAIAGIRDSLEFKLRSLVKKFEGANRGWRISVAIEENVGRKFLEEWRDKIATLSQFIFEATEGQFFITECRIEDRSSNGRIIVEKGKLDWQGMDNKQPRGVLAYCRGTGTRRWEVHAPGKVWVGVLCHELFHGIFGLLDEYYQDPQCACIMRAAPNPQRICNPDTHKGGGRQKEPCWDTIRRRYDDVVYPNPRWRFTQTNIRGRGRALEVDGVLDWDGMKIDECPAPRFIILDN